MISPARLLASLLTVVLLAAACGSSGEADEPAATESEPTAAPSAEPDEEPAPDLSDDPATAFVESLTSELDTAAIDQLVATGDPAYSWIFADALRFFGGIDDRSLAIIDAIETLATIEVIPEQAWNSATNQLIDLDFDPPPDYPELKQRLYTLVDPRWEPLFDDVTSIDLRHVGWGGVFIDDRAFGTSEPCQERGCIPALDLPGVTEADGGDWYDDDSVVFGLIIDGEARAYPKHIMEVHEMVNDTLGNRQIAIPYCTLCGSAQAFYTDNVEGVDGRLVLRTSGLLQRSNKVMFDLNTMSLWDTFTGVAGSGALGASETELEQITVQVSTWGEWKAAYPDTTIVAQDGGIGRGYSLDPLRGRDDDGPIFPIGDYDDRLPVQAQVVTVETGDGAGAAFPVDQARAALDAGTEVSVGDVTLESEGAGFRAVDSSGDELAAHEAFWFAWVQRFPDTQLWEPSL